MWLTCTRHGKSNHHAQQLALYTALVGECEHGIAHVLPSLVISQRFDPPFRLVLCKRLKLLKSVENVRFGPNGEHKAISRVIIDECVRQLDQAAGVRCQKL
jgi:hypothetical protein